MSQTIDQVYSDFNVQGVPASGEKKPSKAEIRALLKMIQNSGGQSVTRNTLTALNGVTPPNENYMGVVLTGEGAGYYSRSGGAWVFGRPFPDTFARVDLAGSGTAQTGVVNAGVNPATTEVFFAKVETPNTGALTLSIGGDAARPVLNIAGNPLSPGEWAGMVMFYLNDANQYQLLIDAGAASAAAASASIAEAAKTVAVDAASEAAGYAELAKDNWTLALATTGTSTPTTDFPLSVDPGTKANMFVSISGILQNVGSYDLIYDDDVPTLRLPESLGEFESLEVRTGSATEVGVPSDGSVGTSQLADKAATLAKLQDVPSGRFIGRLTAGSGPLELLTAAELQSLLAATGTVVDSKYARYTARAALSAVIPADGTVPQITEGTQILTISITPKAVGNKFRIRFRGWGSTDAHPTNLVYAIFRDGQTNAIDAGAAFVPAGGPQVSIGGEVEYTVATVTAHTFSVRVGPSSTANAWLNGSAGNHQVSTAGGCTLVVEEIKG